MFIFILNIPLPECSTAAIQCFHERTFAEYSQIINRNSI